MCIHRYVGYCDYGNGITVDNCETAATEMLVFMLSSLKRSWKWTIGYWFINKIKAPVQA